MAPRAMMAPEAPSRKRWLLLMALAACRPAGPALAASAPPCPLPAGDPLCPLNDAFRDAYVDRRTAALAASGPVLLQTGDRLLLLRGAERLEAPATSARYHALKSVAHVPFALYLRLADVDGPLDPERARRLTAYRVLVERASATIDGRFTDATQRARQRRILDRSLALLATVLGDGRVTAAALHAFVRDQRADLLDNARDAAREQIRVMTDQWSAWAALLTPLERSRLHAVVGTPHMPRRGSLAVQLLQVWLDEPYEGRRADERVAEGSRILVAEGIFDEEGMRALLGTHLVDREAAAAFFDDPLRLDRNLLSDGAEEALRERTGRVPLPAQPGR